MIFSNTCTTLRRVRGLFFSCKAARCHDIDHLALLCQPFWVALLRDGNLTLFPGPTTMKQEMDKNNILWVELRAEDGYKRFEEILNELSIPCQSSYGNLKENLDKIL